MTTPPGRLGDCRAAPAATAPTASATSSAEIARREAGIRMRRMVQHLPRPGRRRRIQLSQLMAPPAALLDVVHEDDDILVVNKPADLVCHPSKNGPLSSLIGRVRAHLGHDEGRLVNRLDRETS